MLGRFFNFLLSMVLRLIRILLVTALRITVQILATFVGALISVGIRLSPLLFRLAIVATASFIAAFDRILDGRISRSRAITFLAAGGLWALVGFLIPWLLFLAMELRAAGIIISMTVGGFLGGLICGFQAQRLPGWRSWTAEEGLRMGDNI